MNTFRYTKRSNDLWGVVGSFGEIREDIVLEKSGTTITKDGIKLEANISKCAGDVYKRCDYITNLSDTVEKLYSLGSRFTLDGGEWEVYSQYNGWQSESLGGWVPLVSSVVSRCNSVRSSHDATPFIALWNKQNERGIAFHVLTGAAWQMRVSRVYSGGDCYDSNLEVEIGVLPDGFCYELESGEKLDFPEILYYEFKSRRDMDCHKLHEYLNTYYPRREMPVVYNTWLAKFDSFTFESLAEQLPRAKELGVEYFVIDAGWFGTTKGWWSGRGDWVENKNIGFMGRMKEFADLVRSYGIKFGFWIEPESASKSSVAFKEHPEYYIDSYKNNFLDFSSPKALKYIFDTVCDLIDTYGAEYIKFDFNADLEFDRHNSAFIRYAKGHEQFIKELRQKYPDIYLENCGSGGTRMSIRDGILYDSFWPSDNESPYVGLRIYKDTLKRMPAQWIDTWTAIASVKGATPVYGCSDDKIIACGDAIWDHVTGVHLDYLTGYMAGSPIGLSFDLNSLTEETFKRIKDYISEFKSRRSFYMNAVCRIIADTEGLTALEYSSPDKSEIEVIIFVGKMIQSDVTLYPDVNEALTYIIENGNVTDGKALAECGIDFEIKKSYSSAVIKMRAVNK